MATFQYLPLDASRREIRLLVVHPAGTGLRDSTLQVSLIKTRLNDSGRQKQISETKEERPLHYTALSYTWGDSQPTYPILLDGMDFKVRQNLHKALLHFRLTEREVIIWIDAVCINQEDEQERESQVAMMRDIYKEAEGVWGWLGPGDAPESRGAFTLLRDLAHREYTNVTVDSQRYDILRSETIDWVRSRPITDVYLKHWIEIAKIFESPWFSRMWVIQEVVLGKVVTAVYGSDVVSFDDVLYYGAQFIIKHLPEVHRSTSGTTSHGHLVQELDERSTKLLVAATRAAEIGRARALRLGHHPVVPRRLPSTVYQVVRDYKNFNVTEPRDKVYALLGILEDYENHVKCPKISYSIPLANLYWEIIGAHIEHSRSLDFLSDAVGLDAPYGTPTWMPRWDDNPAGTLQATRILSLEMAPEVEYKAMADTLPQIAFHPSLNAIHVVGVVGGTVREVGDAPTLPDFSASNGDAEAIFVRYLELRRRVSEQWLSMLDLKEAFNQLQRNSDNTESLQDNKRSKAYTYAGMMLMFDDIHKWDHDDLVALLKKSIGNHPSPFIGIESETTQYSARQLAATCFRRLFVLSDGDFGLGPRDMQPDDVIVFLYGCRVPMVLRPVDGVDMWRLVGEAYCPNQMNGQVLAPDIFAMRADAGLTDLVFWIV
ncbi:heterokaryon incompatibility protein-domain-containing protein [Paraphoma chrysanthemicola]|nr:heterokaryon incompatibility protein-domain-containing protein [Paraphoma chrysanthemicola]